MVAEVVLEVGVERDPVLAEVIPRDGDGVVIPEGRQGHSGRLALVGVIRPRSGFTHGVDVPPEGAAVDRAAAGPQPLEIGEELGVAEGGLAQLGDGHRRMIPEPGLDALGAGHELGKPRGVADLAGLAGRRGVEHTQAEGRGGLGRRVGLASQERPDLAEGPRDQGQDLGVGGDHLLDVAHRIIEFVPQVVVRGEERPLLPEGRRDGEHVRAVLGRAAGHAVERGGDLLGHDPGLLVGLDEGLADEVGRDGRAHDAGVAQLGVDRAVADQDTQLPGELGAVDGKTLEEADAALGLRTIDHMTVRDERSPGDRPALLLRELLGPFAKLGDDVVGLDEVRDGILVQVVGAGGDQVLEHGLGVVRLDERGRALRRDQVLSEILAGGDRDVVQVALPEIEDQVREVEAAAGPLPFERQAAVLEGLPGGLDQVAVPAEGFGDGGVMRARGHALLPEAEALGDLLSGQAIGQGDLAALLGAQRR